MFCSKCGQKNNDDAKFCIGCGAKFEAVPELSNVQLKNAEIKEKQPGEKQKQPEENQNQPDENQEFKGKGKALLIALLIFGAGVLCMKAGHEIKFGVIEILGCALFLAGIMGFFTVLLTQNNSKIAKLDRKLEEKSAVKLQKTYDEVVESKPEWKTMTACFLGMLAGCAFILFPTCSVLGKKLNPCQFVFAGIGLMDKKILGISLETNLTKWISIAAGIALIVVVFEILSALYDMYYLMKYKDASKEARTKHMLEFWRSISGGSFAGIFILFYPNFFMSNVGEDLHIPDFIRDFVFGDAATNNAGITILLIVLVISFIASRKSRKVEAFLQ